MYDPMVGKEQATIPTFRDFFMRFHGRAKTHASVKDIYGYLLVRENLFMWHKVASP